MTLLNKTFAAICLAFGLASAATADNAKISIKCLGPEINLDFTEHNTNAQGVGLGRSPRIQFNVVTAAPVGSGVIFINRNNDGICKVSINSGYRILRGRANFIEVYTDYNRQASTRPPVNTLLQYVTARSDPTQLDSITFRVVSSDKTEQYKGTVALVFNIEYEEAN